MLFRKLLVRVYKSQAPKKQNKWLKKLSRQLYNHMGSANIRKNIICF